MNIHCWKFINNSFERPISIHFKAKDVTLRSRDELYKKLNLGDIRRNWTICFSLSSRIQSDFFLVKVEKSGLFTFAKLLKLA